MSVKNLFNKHLPITSIDELGSSIESGEFINKVVENDNRFVPPVDYTDPKNFAFFGLAEQYYEDTINRIITSYPYDGSKKEKEEFLLSSSYLDLWILENEYPRTNGYVLMGENYGSQVGGIQSGYGSFGSPNYIYFRGGPHTASSGMAGLPLANTFGNSNFYSTASNRASNLEINGANGITLEFWLKKNGWTSGSESPTQVIFDIWNSASYSNNSYGRFRVEIQPGTPANSSRIFIELASGTSGLNVDLSASLSPTSNITGNVWEHHSLAFYNSGSVMVGEHYLNGSPTDNIAIGTTIGLITGSMIGSVGALITSVSGSQGALGQGKLSGSIDELRFWKTRRTAKQIGQNWFTQIGAGTNTDEANTSLGLYYKFNEGIIDTGTVNATDRIVLDYSGRISNGNWIGYTTGSRSTGSAMVQASASLNEFLDPIIHEEHPLVIALKNEKQEIGFAHDTINNGSLYGSFPEWIVKEDQEKGHEVLLKTIQTLASYLDSLYLQIKFLPKLKHAEYPSGSSKPFPFVGRFLESVGMVSPDIFTEAEATEMFSGKDDFRDFESKIGDIKNKIYQNVYNNLPYIYKSKGAEKSFRNILRCFGVDDELIKINLYADNSTFTLEDKFRSTTHRKKFVDFNNIDRFAGTVYQHTSSATSSRSFITSSANALYKGNTYQIECILPKKFEKDSTLYVSTPFLTSSIFGAHTANPATEGDKTWLSPDYGNFQVQVVKTSQDSKDAYFCLTGTTNAQLPTLTSSVFKDAYNNSKWNIAVRIKPKTDPWEAMVSGAVGNNFDVEFIGYNNVLDITDNYFLLTGSITSGSASLFNNSSKRFFVGAHRTNYTGSVREYCDIKASSFRVWMDYLSNETLLAHAKDASNYGSERPSWNVYLSDTTSSFSVITGSSFENSYSLYISGAQGTTPTGTATSSFGMTGGTAPALHLGGGFPMSFSFWAYVSGALPNSLGSGISNPCIFSVGNAGLGAGTREMSIGLQARASVPTTLEWCITDNPDSLAGAAGRFTSPEAYQWTHFLCVYDPSGTANNDRAKVFVNGNISSSITSFVGTIPATTLTSSQRFSLGAQQGANRAMRSGINNFGIYNVALTGTDAELHFNGATPIDLRTITGSANLIHYYPSLQSGSNTMTDAITAFPGITPMDLGLNNASFMTSSIPASGTMTWGNE